MNCDTPKSRLCRFGYGDYIVLASTIALALAEDLSNNDIAILASFLATLSDELALISAVKSCNSENEEDTFVPPPVTEAAASLSRSKESNVSSKKHVRKKVKKKIIKEHKKSSDT